MKKVIAIILTVVMCCACLVFYGCGEEKTPAKENAETAGNSQNVENGNDNKESNDKNDVDPIPQKELKAKDLSIDDFEWETVQAKHEGEDGYSFTLVNNSKYDIIEVTMTYKVKDDVADSDLTLYADFMKENEDFIEETDSPRDVTLIGNKDVLVSKGEEVTMMLIVGFQDLWWYDYPTEGQFALMEPKELEIGVVGENNTLYIAYYDFEDESWILDDATLPADIWSDTEVAQKITKPAEDHHIVIRDKEDEFKVYSYGITADEYTQYIEDIKNAGFEEDFSSSTYFEGKSADGYDVDLQYYEDEEKISIVVEKDD